MNAKKIIIICASAAVVIGAGLFVVFGIVLSPKNVFKKAHKELTDPFIEAIACAISGDTSDLDTGDFKLDTDISFDVTVEKDTLDGVLKLKAEENSAIVDANVNAMGTNVDGIFTYEDNTVGLFSSLLGDKYYTIDFEELPSILNAIGVNIPDVSLSDLSEDRPSKDLVEDVLKNYRDIILDVVNSDNTTRETEDVEFYGIGEEEECKVITFEPTEDDIISVCENLAETMRDDEDLLELIEFFGIDSDLLDDACDELEDHAEDIAEDIVDASFKIQIVLDGSDLSLYRFDIDGDGIEYEMIKDGDEAQIAGCYYRNEGERVKGAIINTSEDDGIISGDVSLIDDDLFTAEFSVDKENKSNLYLPYGSLDIVFNDNRDKISFSLEDDDDVDTGRFEYWHKDKCEVAVNFEATDSSTAEFPSQRSIPITAGNINAIAEEIVNDFLNAINGSTKYYY